MAEGTLWTFIVTNLVVGGWRLSIEAAMVVGDGVQTIEVAMGASACCPTMEAADLWLIDAQQLMQP